MFIRQRDQEKISSLYSLTDGHQSTKADLMEVLGIIRNMGFPHTLIELGKNHFNLVVYCPNDVLEFDLRR